MNLSSYQIHDNQESSVDYTTASELQRQSVQTLLSIAPVFTKSRICASSRCDYRYVGTVITHALFASAFCDRSGNPRSACILPSCMNIQEILKLRVANIPTFSFSLRSAVTHNHQLLFIYTLYTYYIYAIFTCTHIYTIIYIILSFIISCYIVLRIHKLLAPVPTTFTANVAP